MKKTVICQKWEESEYGWGVRPDGYSLHLNEEEREEYIKDYWRKMPACAPDEYSRESGNSYKCEVDLDLYEKIEKSNHGLRFYDNNYPGSGGSSGWFKLKN